MTKNEEEEEIENDEELEEPQQVNGHFWDSLVKYYEGKSPPSGQHAYNTRSRAFTNTPGASSSSTLSNDNNNSQPNKQTQSVKIAQPIQNAPMLDLQYDIIEYLMKTHANISMYDILQIYPIPNSHTMNLSMSSIIPNAKQSVVANNSNNYLTSTDKGKSTADKASLIGKNSKSTTPPFLLTFEIFNRNAHNFMVDSGASSNVMPLSICKRMNGKYVPSNS